MASPRFLVGIDLGTTNTVVAYCEITDNLNNPKYPYLTSTN
ncbi:chaperone protein DnaK [Vibrio sp. JCM 18905]|nr:chaperone protein DnaK [Vibrio sp. JCM 18905]